MLKKSAVALISFLLGIILGVIGLYIYLYPSTSETPLYTWENTSRDFILTVTDGGVNMGTFPLSRHQRFMLTKILDGKSTQYGQIVTVDNTFMNYQDLAIQWLEQGCLIATKDGYQLFMPYPTKTGRI